MRWVVFPVLVILSAGCGGAVVVNGTSPTPTPTVSQSPTATPTPGPPERPDATAFETDVQPFFDNASNPCFQAGCHSTAGPAQGLVIYLNPTPQQLQDNYDQMSCYPFAQTYTPPDSTLLNKFCNGPVSNVVTHNSNTASDDDCAAIFGWMQTGNGSAADFPCN